MSALQGSDVSHGDHLCGVYRGSQERNAILFPFIEAGMRSGDKCICVVDGMDPADVIAGLAPDLSARERANGRQLDVIRSADLYLRSGRFSWSEAIGAWKSAISEVMYDGRFHGVHAVETWSLLDVEPDKNELMMLESKMNRFMPLFPQQILCLYDLDCFGGGIVVDLLRTHPKMLVRGMVAENPYYLDPDDFGNRGQRAEKSSDRELADLVDSITA